MYNNEELRHYGIPGMRWGKRKALPTSDLRSRYDQAKKAAKKSTLLKEKYKRDDSIQSKYWKELESIEKKYKRGQLLSDKDNKREIAADSRAQTGWANSRAKYKADRIKRKNEFKQIKKERKEAIRKQYDEVNKNSKLGEKLFYNDATRRAAAKYMVDNNMTMTEAKKKAKKKAIRNTGAILGGLAAYGGYQYLKNR